MMNSDSDSELELELDSSWIEEFENADKDFKMFYAEDMTFVKIHYIYINEENEIEKIKEDKILFKVNGILLKEDLINIIKHNSILNSRKYSLLSLLKFNLNIDPMHLKSFLKNRNNNANIGSPFLQPLKEIDTIHFEKSITFFHDINELLFLFRRKDISKNKALNHTRKNWHSNVNTAKITRRQK